MALSALIDSAAERLQGREGDGLDAASLSEARRWLTTLTETSGGNHDRFFEAVALASEAARGG